MNCLKCGQDVLEGQVFCNECLEDMKKYPVRPGTAVHLPKRPAYPPRRVIPKRKTISLEEKVIKQRRIIQRLSWALFAAVLLASLLAYPAIIHLMEGDDFLPGQNYSVIQELLPGNDRE